MHIFKRHNYAFQKRHASRRSSQNSIIIFWLYTGKCPWHLLQKSGTLSHHAYRKTEQILVELHKMLTKNVRIQNLFETWHSDNCVKLDTHCIFGNQSGQRSCWVCPICPICRIASWSKQSFVYPMNFAPLQARRPSTPALA